MFYFFAGGPWMQKSEKKRNFKNRHHDAIVAAIILVPMFLWWLVSNGLPTLFGFALGFFEWKNISAAPVFIGLRNFITFFTDKTYLGDLWRTIWLGVLCTLLTVLSGFLVSMLMNLPLFAKGIYRTIWYIPAVTSTIAITQVMNILFNPIDGAVNIWMEKMGMEAIIWSESVFWTIVLIVVFSVWKGVGGAALIWLAGLQAIDPVLYEAASVDGAGRWSKFKNITLPSLKPIAIYVVVTGIIGSLQIYEPVAFISNGGPMEQSMVLPLRIVRDGFFNFNFGMAGASGLVLAIIAFISSATFYKFSKEDH
jgi:multiple sugar transport system permease protein